MPDSPIPTHYVIRTTSTSCANCGTTTRTSEFFAHYLISARHHTGAPVRQHKYCAAPEFNLEVKHEPGTRRTTPFCSTCRIIDLSHLPPPPSADRLYDLAEVTLKHQQVRKSAPATKPVKLSIKDLA